MLWLCKICIAIAIGVCAYTELVFGEENNLIVYRPSIAGYIGGNNVWRIARENCNWRI